MSWLNLAIIVILSCSLVVALHCWLILQLWRQPAHVSVSVFLLRYSIYSIWAAVSKDHVLILFRLVAYDSR
jgi:hypothetical protein